MSPASPGVTPRASQSGPAASEKEALRATVRAARAAGVHELADVTLHQNAPMIGLARALGFTVRRDPKDARLTQLRKALDTDA